MGDSFRRRVTFERFDRVAFVRGDNRPPRSGGGGGAALPCRGRRRRLEQRLEAAQQRGHLGRLEHGGVHLERRPLARRQRRVRLDEQLDLLARQPQRLGRRRPVTIGRDRPAAGIRPHGKRLRLAAATRFGDCAGNVTLTANSSQLVFGGIFAAA
jgi:hypothetical protein